MNEQKLDLPDGVPPLNSYYVYLTGGCNLACRHCWISPAYQSNGGTGGHLDYKLFALAIEEGLPLGLNHVKLTGGEPLLHPDFLRIVDLLHKKTLGLSIETNGTLITKSLAYYLKERSTLGSISVSLDGSTKETHDPFRGVKGSFEKTVQGIRFLVEAGYHPQVIMSIHPGNIQEIEEVIRLAESLGTGSVKFNLIQPTGRGKTMLERNQVLNIENMIELGRWIENDLQKQSSIHLHYSWPMAFYSLERLLDFSGYSCSVSNILGILSTGHLALCGIGVQVPELCYGHLGEDRVADIWSGHPTLIKLRQQIPANLEGICGVCVFRDRCLGMCVAENYSYYGNLTSPFWFCQTAVEKGLFPVSRCKEVDE